MERKAFQLLHDAESSWWYEGRAFVVSRVLKRFQKKAYELHIADIGAGFGGMFRILKPYADKLTAVEPDLDARLSCITRGYDVVCDTDITSLPSGTFDIITLFDVLEHTPDDRAFLKEADRILKDHGALLLTVPAYQWLWSAHDVAHHHYRRYSRTELATLLTDAGFIVRYVSYWNMKLFIPAAIVRLLGRSGEGALTMPRALDRLFFAIVRLESFFIPTFRLPFGTGIVCYATKK